jgi:HEPN domain-containing protein
MELGLKALLIQRDRASGKLGTYSIFVLLKSAYEIDERFSRFGSKAWHIDTLYYFTRYPFGETAKLPRDFFNDPEEAEDALGVAKEVLDEVRLSTEPNMKDDSS